MTVTMAVIMVGAAGFEPTTTSPPDFGTPARPAGSRTGPSLPLPAFPSLSLPLCCHIGCQSTASPEEA